VPSPFEVNVRPKAGCVNVVTLKAMSNSIVAREKASRQRLILPSNPGWSATCASGVSNPPVATKNIWRLRSDLPTNSDQLGDRFKLLPERRARNAVAKAALFGLRTAARCIVDSRRRLQCGLLTFAYARS
jgi:hypothetical protein